MPDAKVDAWFETIESTQRSTLTALRRLVLMVAPEAIEEIKWSRPCYSNARGMFCYLHTTRSYATMGFQKGAALDDPDGLLEGTGKDMRHIKFKNGRSPNDPAVAALLNQASAS